MSGTHLERVKALLAALPAADQAELRRYLADLDVSDDEAEALQVASLQARRGGKQVTYTFRQEHVRCGKENCWCSSGGIGHGPYTYKYWKEDGKLRKAYVGAGEGARRVRAKAST